MQPRFPPLPRFVVAIARALRFYSRLALPPLPGETGAAPLDFAEMAPAVPVAGALIGLAPAAALLIAHGLGLGPLVAATLAVACGIAVTGALHEDGLADTADGFFARVGAERRLEIMRDSRIGSFGALALVVAVLLRAALLASFMARPGIGGACAALIAAAALSRAAGLLPLALLPPARRDGAGAAAGRLPRHALARAALIGVAIALALTLLGHFGLLHAILACLGAFTAAFGMTALAQAKLGGQTGDIAGAAQVLAEIAFYLCLGTGLTVAA